MVKRKTNFVVAGTTQPASRTVLENGKANELLPRTHHEQPPLLWVTAPAPSERETGIGVRFLRSNAKWQGRITVAYCHVFYGRCVSPVGFSGFPTNGREVNYLRPNFTSSFNAATRKASISRGKSVPSRIALSVVYKRWLDLAKKKRKPY